MAIRRVTDTLKHHHALLLTIVVEVLAQVPRR